MGINLVKQAEYAKTLPVPSLQKYADGLNPDMLAPWLATAQMDTLTKTAEMQNARQGAANGPQPTIKDQVEQKAGLLALQQAQQQASQQQTMQAPPMAGPVPDGTPQPRPQPQPPEGMFMAARGGLARLPSHFNFDGGGIVAFAGKGPSKVVNPDAGFWDWLQATSGISKDDFINRTPQKTKNELLDMFRSSESIAPPPNAQAAQAAQAAKAVPAAAAAETAAAEAAMANRMYAPFKAAGSFATKAAKATGIPGALASTVSEFGDYKLKSDDNVDTSASGTYNDLRQGNVGRAVKGLGMGLGELGADLGSSVANTLDYVVPGKAPVSSAYDQMLRGTGLFKDKPEEAAAAQQADMASENARLAAKAPVAETAMGNEGRRTGPVAMGVNPNANPNLVPASARPQGAPQGNQGNVPGGGGGGGGGSSPAVNSLASLYRQSLEGGPKERKIADLIAEQNEIRKGSGLGEEAGLAKLQRIKAMQDQFQATKPDSIDDMINVLGRAGQYKGLSGTGNAYTANQAQKRAQELAMAEKINELMGGVEDTQRAEKVGMAGKVGEGRAKDLEQTAQFNREKMQSLGSASSSQYTADMHYKAAMAAAAQRGDHNEIAKINAASQLAARDETINNWQTQLKELAKMPLSANRAKMATIEKQISDRTKAIYGQFGITIPEAPSAASPSGTTNKPGWGIKPI